MRAFAFLVVILLAVSVAFAQTVFHPASEVAAGIFGSAVGGGNYTFNNSMFVVDKLGVGTTNPSGVIHVSTAGAAGGNFFFDVYSNTNPAVFATRRARGTIDSPSAVQINDILAGYSGRGYGATGFASGPRGSFIIAAAENWTDTAQGSFLRFITVANGTTTTVDRMRITDAGYVGIGTTSPATNLNVIGDIQLQRSLGASDAAINFGSNANNYIYSGNGANIMAFATGGTERVRIDQAGNVGIGIASPAYKLEVAGPVEDNAAKFTLNSGRTTIGYDYGLVLQNTNNTDGNYMSISNFNSAGAGNSWIDFVNMNQTYAGAIKFATRSTLGEYGYRMIIGETGNVSIPSLTAGRIVYTGTGGALSTNADLTYGSDALSIKSSTANPTVDIVSYQAAGYAPAILGLYRIGAGVTATPDNSQIAEMRFTGYSTAPAYYVGANIVASGGVNTINGFPTSLTLNVNNGDGVGQRTGIYINPTANVGIGTTSTGTNRLIVHGSTNTSSAMAIRVEDSSGNPIFVARNDRRVGIGGVTDPYEALQISGAIRLSAFVIVTANASTWTDLDSTNYPVASALYLIKLQGTADLDNIRTYAVLLQGSAKGCSTVVLNSVAAGTSTITASFQGSGIAQPYKIQVNPSVQAYVVAQKIVY